MSDSDEKRAAFVEGNSVSPEELHAKYGIPQEEIEAFRELIRIYSSADIIIEEAEKDKTMYVLRFGTVKVFRRSGAEQKFMGTMDAVTIFGEMSVLNDEPRSATVIAMTDTRGQPGARCQVWMLVTIGIDLGRNSNINGRAVCPNMSKS